MSSVYAMSSVFDLNLPMAHFKDITSLIMMLLYMNLNMQCFSRKPANRTIPFIIYLQNLAKNRLTF